MFLYFDLFKITTPNYLELVEEVKECASTEATTLLRLRVLSSWLPDLLTVLLTVDWLLQPQEGVQPLHSVPRLTALKVLD